MMNNEHNKFNTYFFSTTAESSEGFFTSSSPVSDFNSEFRLCLNFDFLMSGSTLNVSISFEFEPTLLPIFLLQQCLFSCFHLEYLVGVSDLLPLLLMLLKEEVSELLTLADYTQVLLLPTCLVQLLTLSATSSLPMVV